MLAINGKSLSTDFVKNTKIYKFYERAIREIKKKPVWTFEIHPSLVTMPDARNENSVREESAGELYPTKFRFNVHASEEIESFELQWYLSSRTDKNGKLIFSPSHYDYKGRKTLHSKTDADEIFFLMCCMPICETYEPMKEFTNTTVCALVYRVVDKEGEAKKANEMEDLTARVRAKLFGDMKLDEEKIRELGASFKILNALDPEIIGIEEVKSQLKSKILKRNARGKLDIKLIKEFLDLAGNDGVVKIRSAIQNATEKKIIALRRGGKKLIWKFLDEKGEDSSDLLAVHGGRDPEEVLVAHLASNEDIFKNLQELISEKV